MGYLDGIHVTIYTSTMDPMGSRHSTLEVQRDHFAVVKLTTDPQSSSFSPQISEQWRFARSILLLALASFLLILPPRKSAFGGNANERTITL
jgi:hypothetical protein